MQRELDAALASGAEIVGVNNRNLHTFEVHSGNVAAAGGEDSGGVFKVSESGIHSRADVVNADRRRAIRRSWSGEHLMKSPDPGGGAAERSNDGQSLRDHAARRRGGRGASRSVGDGIYLL